VLILIQNKDKNKMIPLDTLEEYLENNIMYLLADKYNKDNWVMSSFDNFEILELDNGNTYKVNYILRNASQYEDWLNSIPLSEKTMQNLDAQVDKRNTNALFTKSEIALFIIDNAKYFVNSLTD